MQVNKNISPRTRVHKHIRQLLSYGQLVHGESLPSELTLSSELGVARTTVRAAMQEMEQAGLVKMVNRRRIICQSPVLDNKSIVSQSVVVVDSETYKADTPGEGWEYRILSGLSIAAHTNKFNTLILHANDNIEETLLSTLQESPVGLIILHENSVIHEQTEKLFKLLTNINIPTVCYGSGIVSDYKGVDIVTSDHYLGSYKVTEWLINHGCRRIVRFWRLNSAQEKRPIWLKKRDEGYETAMNNAGLSILPAIEYHETEYTNESDQKIFQRKGYEAAGRLAEYMHEWGEIDAVVAISDGVVPSLGYACTILNYKPNDDIWLAGYDNISSFNPDMQWEPIYPIVTVDKQNHKIGKQLIDMIMLRRTEKISLSTKPYTHILKPILIENKSSIEIKDSVAAKLPIIKNNRNQIVLTDSVVSTSDKPNKQKGEV